MGLGALVHGSVPKYVGCLETSLHSVNLDVAAERGFYIEILFELLDQMSSQKQEDRTEIIKDYPDVFLLYANHLFSARKFAEARESARRALDYEQPIGTRLMVTRSYYNSGQLAEVKEIFRSFYQEYQDVNVLCWYG